MKRFGIVLLACIVACLTATTANAVSYIGFGGGFAPHVSTEGVRTSYDSDLGVTHRDSFELGSGWSIEAQFGWEMAPWVDAEGAMRYHRAARSDTSTLQVSIDNYELIGFEGGLRLHTRRYITNTTPYLRLGVGSYSTTLNHRESSDNIGFDPTLGYFIGAGYTYEVSSKFGVDARASLIVYDVNESSLLKMDAVLLSVVVSLIIF